MKKGILSVTGCAIALSMLAAPAANADTASGEKVQTDIKPAVYSQLYNLADTKETENTPNVKLKEPKSFLKTVNKKINNVDTDFQNTFVKVNKFYSSPHTAHQESVFYKRSVQRLNAQSRKLENYKKKLNQFTDTSSNSSKNTAEAYQEISNLQQSIRYEKRQLNDFHTFFSPVVLQGTKGHGQKL